MFSACRIDSKTPYPVATARVCGDWAQKKPDQMAEPQAVQVFGYLFSLSACVFLLWQLAHNGCQFVSTQNAPPCVTGWMWSTTEASFMHIAQTGCRLRKALRARLHLVVL